ncbi:MAG: carboxyl transferase domain-containing protein [Acidimicrobiales bacterium]|jgi:acetyl-CoA carboxylase carboxyl transferase subunit beta
MTVGQPAAGEPKDAIAPDVTIEREIAEVVRGSYARTTGQSGKRRIGARELFSEVLDPDSFRNWDTDLVDVSAGPEYLDQLAEARRASGEDEAVITGEGRIRGRRVCVVACEFAFLGGTIGVAAAERLTLAIERATAERLPLVASPVSGGTRMQEGTVAFLQMVKIVQALMQHRRAGLPYLVYLRHPTTGGVFASWGSLGQLTGAQPGALIGFLGPRVYEALYGASFPEGIQVAENLYRLGLVDAVLVPGDLSEIADRALDVMCTATGEIPAAKAPPDELVDDVPAWESIERTRRVERPGVEELLRAASHSVTILSGTQEGERSGGLILAMAKFGAAPCVVVGQDRLFPREGRPLGPDSLREARRGMSLAAEIGLPLLTIIDTPGAALSKEAEEGGLAGEIARCLADMVTIPVPTVCLLLGEGAGGGALALLPADRVVAAQHGWVAPLPPEGASEILYRTVERAPELAAAQGVRSIDLAAAGIVDRIVPERPDAAEEPRQFLGRLSKALEYELTSLIRWDKTERLGARHRRYRRLGLHQDP